MGIVSNSWLKAFFVAERTILVFSELFFHPCSKQDKGTMITLLEPVSGSGGKLSTGNILAVSFGSKRAA